MKYIYRSIVLLISIVVLWSCTSGDSIVDYSELTNEDLKSEKTSGYNEDRNVYFGDLHVHTLSLIHI